MILETRFGPAWAAIDPDGGLAAFGFGVPNGRERGYSAEVARQVEAYCDGSRTQFELSLTPVGTPFQKLVWAELCRIPFGATISYAELALRVGRPGAARAVGRANATNPLALIVPCHRVIGSAGALTGYAYGIGLKHTLIEWEGLRIRSSCTIP